MDFKVIFRDTFLEDLERVVTSVAAHNPVAARKLGELIISAGESLSFFPERHPRAGATPGHQEVHREEVFQSVLSRSPSEYDSGNSAMLGWAPRDRTGDFRRRGLN